MVEDDIEIIEKRQSYVLGMRPVFNKEALFSDGTDEYCSPSEPAAGDAVTIRFRTKKNNVDAVWLIVQENEIRMKRALSRGSFDYYEAELIMGIEPLVYYFKIIAGTITCFYNRNGTCRQIDPHYNFRLAPGFHTPDWAKGAVMYQIFTDRFCNGDPANDVVDREYIYIRESTKRITDWNRYPAAMDVREFYGGDLEGVRQKLDYLQELGVEVIYFNPLFVSPSNHKYDIQDYDYIDPHYGKIVDDGGEPLEEWEHTNDKASKYIYRVANRKNLEASNQLFIELVEEIHRRGMKVILDGVFNHCGSFNKWMDRERIYEHAEDFEKGAYVKKDSPYRTFFKFLDENGWPYNEQYDGWWGHDTLPKLNYEESEKLYEYIMEIARKWVSPPFNVDGWRLDVAADLGHSVEYNHNFWKEFRKVVKEANPEAIILAEHYGTPADWLQGDEWDTVMNYDAFMEPLTWFLTGMEKHSDEYRHDLLGNPEAFIGAMNYHMASFMNSSLQVSMNELSNHDHSRFLTRTNHKVGRTGTLGPEAANEGVKKSVLREAVLFQMTWPGAPTIYYGDEAGVCGFTDPDNRRTYPWGREDHEMIQFHKDLIALRREYPTLRKGSVKFLYTAYSIISYGRFDSDGQFIMAVNNGDHEAIFEIPVWEVDVPRYTTMERLILTTTEGYTMASEEYQVAGGYMKVTLPPESGIILKHQR